MFNYRTAGVWGGGLGRNLTPAEVDANWAQAEDRLTALEGAEVTPINIANFVVTGSTFTVVMDDATVFGPYPLPVASFRWRDEYVPGGSYAAMDLFTVPDDGVYLALIDHVGPDPFDPEAVDGSSDALGPLFKKMFGVAPAGMAGVDEITDPAYAPLLSDNGRLKLCTQACEITIPFDADVAYPVGAALSFSAEGVSTETDPQPVNVVGASNTDGSVVIDVANSFLPQTAEQFSIITVIKKEANRWTVTGHLALAV